MEYDQTIIFNYKGEKCYRVIKRREWDNSYIYFTRYVLNSKWVDIKSSQNETMSYEFCLDDCVDKFPEDRLDLTVRII